MKANDNSSSPNKKMHFFLRLLVVLNIFNSLGLIGSYLATYISPADFWYLAFFGLAYPVFLLIGLLFVLFWAFFRWKLMFISVLTIVVGWNHFNDFVAYSISSPELSSKMKVVSYNVRVFNLYNPSIRIESRNEIFNFLDQSRGDIFCFQEFFNQEGVTDFNTRDSLIDLLGTSYYHEGYTHALTDRRFFGVVTFSKYPIINKGEVPFVNDENNSCIYSDIVTPLDTIRVFNAHIGSIRLQQEDYALFDQSSGDDLEGTKKTVSRILRLLKRAYVKRADQTDRIVAAIKESPYPVLLCGDLNDTPVSYCYRQLNSLLEDAFVNSGWGIGKTYVGVVPSNRIDYIFYSEEFSSEGFEVHDLNVSDHKPISSFIGKE